MSDTIESVSFALLCYVIVHLQQERPRGRIAMWGGAIAASSYTLYLAHAPLIAFASGLLMPVWKPWPVNAIGFVKFGATCALVYTIVVALYWMFERNTPAVRAWMTGIYQQVAGSRPASRSEA